MTTKPEILALFSQGLDSILAIKIIQQQGLQVKALKFITPFFGYDIKGREAEYCEQIRKSYAIDLEIIDTILKCWPLLNMVTARISTPVSIVRL